MPVFWEALILILLFAFIWPILPMHGGVQEHGWQALVLPVLAIATHPAALIARMTRSSMLEVLTQDYVRTAVSKGLPLRHVVFGHALRNALNPVITVIGFQFGNLIGGAVVVEFIFAIPGMGFFAHRRYFRQRPGHGAGRDTGNLAGLRCGEPDRRYPLWRA